jgi:hypothetical protein
MLLKTQHLARIEQQHAQTTGLIGAIKLLNGAG